MAIRKGKQNKNYTVVPNAPLRDKQMSWKAKGLLSYLLSMDDDWVIHKNDLSNRSTDGYDSTLKAFNELVEKGYILDLGRDRDERGFLKENIYEVYDTPQNDAQPTRDFPDQENPSQENRQLRSTSTPVSRRSTKLKKEVNKFVAPSLQDVIDYFLAKGYKKEAAEKAFDYYDSNKDENGNWFDGRGEPVLNWKMKMISVWFKEENKDKSKQEQQPELKFY